MPKRTLGLETIRCRPGHNRRNKLGDLSDLEGRDLLHLFHAWARDVDPDTLVDKTKGRYLKITDFEVHGRSVLVEAESGFFGEPGKTIDVTTHQVTHKRTATQSATEMTRLVLTVPPKAEMGIFGVERQSNQGAGPALIAAFRRALMSAFSTFSFDHETLVESSAWTDGAHLLSVSAVAYSVPVDLGDGVTSIAHPLGRLEQTLEPERGHEYLPAGLLKALRERKVKVSDFLAFRDDTPIDDTFVTVTRDGRKKTFSLDREGVPAIRLLLSKDGEAAPTTIEFLRKCQNEARDFYQKGGYTWSSSWEDGKWDAAALSVKMPPPATA
ncbi:hypothetical protein [Gryllotalpicola ginsengisoli]|uniref:hypothetical protein n=1 Tax=Gryllotalpicola ginsengisoli TaxID=444608 RepID=UPI0003B6074C|nr:hypothetical protein [Gryllotalpicola ginsengisoli]